uniref:Uncharacterized protein n=1 Tax=Lepeophtheirus salmonis TaxID=72036 RepID=A0A0K2VHL6_LEPSM
MTSSVMASLTMSQVVLSALIILLLLCKSFGCVIRRATSRVFATELMRLITVPEGCSLRLMLLDSLTAKRRFR